MRWVVIPVAFLLATGCTKQPEVATTSPSVVATPWRISGSVTCHQRLKPSANTTVMVGLLDVSHSFYAPSSSVAVQVIKHVKRFPVAYTLIDPSRIESGHTYALRAIVGDDGGIRFVSASQAAMRPKARLGPVIIEVIPVAVWYRRVPRDLRRSPRTGWQIEHSAQLLVANRLNERKHCNHIKHQ